MIPRLGQVTNIQLDPNGTCGSKCWFCPVRFIERPPHQIMLQETFERILDSILDAVKLGSVKENFTLWLSSYNDVLLDPLLRRRLEALRARKLRFACLSNGIGLLKTYELLHEFRDVAVCYAFDVPAGNRESYSKHTLNRPEVFDRIVSGLRALYELDPDYYRRVIAIGVNGVHEAEWDRNQIKYDLPIGDTDTQVAQLKALFPMLPRIEAVKPLCDRAGSLKPFSINNNAKRPGSVGCNRLTEWLHINSLGEAYTCCQDYAETTKFANLNDISVHNAITIPHDEAVEKCLTELCLKCWYAKGSLT